MWVTRKLLWEAISRPNFGEEMWLLFFFFLRWWHGKTHRCSVAIYSQKVQLLIRCISLFLCLFLSSVFRMLMLRMLVFQEPATHHVLFSTLLHILMTMLSKLGNWHWERGSGISPKSQISLVEGNLAEVISKAKVNMAFCHSIYFTVTYFILTRVLQRFRTHTCTFTWRGAR